MSKNTPQSWRSIFCLPFVLCALVLTVAAVGDGLLADLLSVVREKSPLYLRSPLAKLDRTALAPYRFVQSQNISSDVQTALGANDFIFWVLEDTSITDVRDRRRFAELNITYYTGTPDLAPHTPDVCLLASGYDPKMAHETRTMHVATLPPGEADVPIRVLTFVKSSVFNRDEPSVVYTFHCNGQFIVDKIKLMRKLNGRHNRHEYYCKVEVSFSDHGNPRKHAGRDETVESARKLFEILLPLLEEHHWPDWDASESAAGTTGGSVRAPAGRVTDAAAPATQES